MKSIFGTNILKKIKNITQEPERLISFLLLILTRKLTVCRVCSAIQQPALHIYKLTKAGLTYKCFLGFEIDCN